ncbi:MAG TPA: hypothetical protein VIZ28_18845 [Chitinophagaceae bacterium]
MRSITSSVLAATLLFNLLAISSFAQDRPQLRLKLGATKNFMPPPNMSVGYAYKTDISNSPYPVIGLEYSKPLKNGRSFFFAGVSLDIQNFSAITNEKNVTLTMQGGSPGVVTGVWKAYIGFESRFSKKILPPHKNYFTWFVGMGLSINPFTGSGVLGVANYDYRDPNGFGTMGTTHDGRILKGTEIYLHNQTRVSPTVMAGIRWHIRNKRGNDVMLVELLVNYGLTRYYNYEIHYRLNDQPAIDKLGQKGICVQLNILIPLANFGKRKK